MPYGFRSGGGKGGVAAQEAPEVGRSGLRRPWAEDNLRAMRAGDTGSVVHWSRRGGHREGQCWGRTPDGKGEF